MQRRLQRLAEVEHQIVRRASVDEHAREGEQLGPGGLDPVEVFETLPRAMQEAFESKDVARLQDALMGLPNEEANGRQAQAKRC